MASHKFVFKHWPRRLVYIDAPINSSLAKQQASQVVEEKLLPCLSIMPTHILFRSLLVTSVLSSPRLVSVSLPFMKTMADAKTWFFNPDRNLVLHKIVRKLIYDHFCAGENEEEVKNTIATTKAMGYEGVILGYAKEALGNENVTVTEAVRFRKAEMIDETIEVWKRGNLRTLSMLGSGDFLAIKFTGAGPSATEALALGKDSPPAIYKGMLDLCEAATKQNTRIWIDAEQQLFQGTIDNWTIGLMQKYNRRGKVLVYTTMQAYLKSTSNNITKHLKLAQEEGWAIGIKLVRGAYIASEPRHLIHDTEEETHTAYDSIVQHLLARSFPGIPSELEFPTVQLFLASHNAKSVRKAYSTWRSRKEAGLPTVNLEFGQLQGMADEVSCGLLQLRQQIRAPGPAVSMDDLSPRAFKCLSWGTTRECMQFLFRRAIENRDAVQRTRCWMAGLKGELWRRVKNVIRFD